MAIHSTSRAVLSAVLLCSTACIAQTAPAPSPPDASCATQSQAADMTTKPCPAPADAKKPTVSEQFPFPSAPSKPKSPPDSPAPSAVPSSAETEHPFPTALPPKLPGDDSSSSSSSSSADSSNDDSNGTPDLPPGTEGTSTHRKLPKVKRVQTDDERVDEDITVAKFYMNDDNLQGAYLRAKEAVKIQPEYSNAHFTLAQVAQKMKKKDEAVAEFKAYLKLDPEGEQAKAAQRALAELH